MNVLVVQVKNIKIAVAEDSYSVNFNDILEGKSPSEVVNI